MIHRERNRRGAVVFACSVGDDLKTALPEVPAWMLMRLSVAPVDLDLRASEPPVAIQLRPQARTGYKGAPGCWRGEANPCSRARLWQSTTAGGRLWQDHSGIFSRCAD